MKLRSPHPLPPWHPPPHHPHGATCAADGECRGVTPRRHAARRRRSERGLGDEELNVNMVNMWLMILNNMVYQCWNWLVVSTYPSEKWWSSSVGMMKFPIYGKKCSKPPTSEKNSFLELQVPKTAGKQIGRPDNAGSATLWASTFFITQVQWTLTCPPAPSPLPASVVGQLPKTYCGWLRNPPVTIGK